MTPSSCVTSSRARWCGSGGPKRGLESFRFAPRTESAYCSFEYTYFAHPSSRVNGVSVYEARKRVGKILAKKHGMRGNVVIPVPDSARPAALGYSVQSGIPMDEGLMKDRYRRKGSMRSFIEPRQSGREEVVKRIIPIREAIEGKEVIVVDDSVVRGTSSRIIVDSLKKAGAKRVGMVVTFPPISYPCYMGVDFPSRDELISPPGRERGHEHSDRREEGRQGDRGRGVPLQRHRGAQPGDRPARSRASASRASTGTTRSSG